MQQNCHVRVAGGCCQCALNVGQAEERRDQHTKSQAAVDEDGEHDCAWHNNRGILDFFRHLRSCQLASSSGSFRKRVVIHESPHLHLFTLLGILLELLTDGIGYIPVNV